MNPSNRWPACLYPWKDTYSNLHLGRKSSAMSGPGPLGYAPNHGGSPRCTFLTHRPAASTHPPARYEKGISKSPSVHQSCARNFNQPSSATNRTFHLVPLTAPLFYEEIHGPPSLPRPST